MDKNGAGDCELAKRTVQFANACGDRILEVYASETVRTVNGQRARALISAVDCRSPRRRPPAEDPGLFVTHQTHCIVRGPETVESRTVIEAH